MSTRGISLLLFSDTHIGFDHPLTNREVKHRKRGPDFFQNFKKIIDEAITRKVDYVVHCGDVFETKKVPAFLVDQTYAEFLRLANANISLIIVPGNHERSALPTSLFLNHPNIYIFNSPTNFLFPDLSFSGFPYYRGDIRSLFSEYRRKMESGLHDDHFNILCVHHAIDGVKAGRQFFEFRNRKDTLAIDDLPGKYDLILSGHIHKYQVMYASNAERKIPIIYSGSTERTMFDEIEETKGYHIFEIKGKKYSHQFHPIYTRPMYQIDLKSEQVEVEQLKDYLSIEMMNMDKDAIVQIAADNEQLLYKLSKLKTEGFFLPTMNITLSGFSSLHRTRAD
ncbi:MAG: DNA repair exonuclease [Reichenbachiella sp.]|uniref:metallophosphoesterase family protein n=1 Tax=Reichenbachiella sp. TaxID=2184521 RepID=UPI003265510B